MNIPIIKRQMDVVLYFIKKYQLTNLVELGCGEGHNMKKLIKHGHTVITGLDKSAEAVKLASDKSLHVIHEDIFNYEMSTKTTALLLMVLEHIKDDFSMLKTFTSNDLIISVPACSIMYSKQDKLAGHYRRYDYQDLKLILNKTGYGITEKVTIGYPISNFYTKLYNMFLAECEIQESNTKNTGIKNKTPFILRLVSNVVYQILKIDRIFWHTNKGTHYIIYARKK